MFRCKKIQLRVFLFRARAGGGIGLRGFLGNPFLENSVTNREQGRSEKNANKTKSNRAAEHAEENQQKRRRTRAADQPRLQKIIDAPDAERPNQNENSPG